jgi:hypothetical protein
MNTLAKHILNTGGTIVPLIIPSSETQGLGIMNPSILVHDDKVLVNLRQVNYTFYHSEAKLFQHPYGPLTYLHPENDIHLRTWNWLLHLDDDLNITTYHKIDTSQFDTYSPLWDFVGLEDARLVHWDDKLYITGVRRDTTPHGEGRMELSEIVISDNGVREVSRLRIPTPRDLTSYCEKNWMPVLDLPYHFVKWTNPLELVQVDTVSKTTKTVLDGPIVGDATHQRGGSQVISIPGGRMCITHEVQLFKSETARKDAIYRHRFVIWDNDWNVKHISRCFSIMGGHVEFAVGLCQHNDSILLTYGFQDNAAYILKTDINSIMSFINAN